MQESENNKRVPPWTMKTIREVLDTMRFLIENEGCELDTPIVWYHLEDGNLTGVSHECSHVFHEDDESWVELTLHDPHATE